ncbi:MAG TPA: STAS/SEC14 domain-containing protein [Candidatus Acidoferrales bacterium]|jgi:hypothetical protein|nr:STAS/SEC14 domain-containing protein [Candidatus Acidoferrales bacterium]
MPVMLGVDHEHRQVNAVAMGSVTYADAQAHMKLELRQNARGYRKYVDFRGAGIQISPAEIRQIVEQLREVAQKEKIGPTAVVVSSDQAYGMMRMLEMLVEDVCEIRPFREEAEARAWLEARSSSSP